MRRGSKLRTLRELNFFGDHHGRKYEYPCGEARKKAYEKALDSLGAEPKKTAALHLKRDGTFDFLVLDGGAESWQVFSSLLTVLKYKQKYFGR